MNNIIYHWDLKLLDNMETEDIKNISEQVEQRLLDADKNRKVKDVGRVQMSKKQLAGYRIITMGNIDEINQDEVIAFNLVKKDSIWQPINVDEQKTSGVSSGACYLKVRIRESIPAKPKNDKDKRKSYVKFLNVMQNDLLPLTTVNEIRQQIEKYLNFTIIEAVENFVDANLATYDEATKKEVQDKWMRTSGYKFISANYFNKKVMTELFSTTFVNMLTKNSESAHQAWQQAEIYEASEGDEAGYIEKATTRKNNLLQITKEKISAFEGADMEGKYKIISAFYQKPPSLREYKDENSRMSHKYWDATYTNRLQGNLREAEEPIVIPDRYKKRENDWSWAIKKDKTEVEGSENIKDKGRKINTKEPLSYIKRINGYKTPEPTPENIVNYFGFSAYNFGKYVPDNERGEHAKHFLGALTDLGEILNYDIKQVHQMTGLGFGVGLKGYGGHLAAYFSQTKDINLVRGKGDGSVAHEWGHFFDNMLCDYSEKKAIPLFASTSENTGDPVLDGYFHEFGVFCKGFGEGKEYKDEVFPAVPTTADYSNRVKILGTIDESISAFMAQAPESAKKYFTDKYWTEYREKYLGYIIDKHGLTHYTVPLRLNTSRFWADSAAQGSEYWTRGVELFARAFETYIFNKLAKANMGNNYLAHDAYLTENMPYPRGKEYDFIEQLFDKITLRFKEIKNIRNFVPIINEKIGEEIIEFVDSDKIVKPKIDVKLKTTKESEINENNIQNNNDMKIMVKEPETPALKINDIYEQVNDLFVDRKTFEVTTREGRAKHKGESFESALNWAKAQYEAEPEITTIPEILESEGITEAVDDNYTEQKYFTGDEIMFFSALTNEWNKGHIESAKFIPEPNELTGTQGWHYEIPESGSMMVAEKNIKPVKEEDVNDYESEDGKLIYHAATKGGKYEIKVFEKKNSRGSYYSIENYTNGSHSGSSSISDIDILKKTLERNIKDSAEIDGIIYITDFDIIFEGSTLTTNIYENNVDENSEEFHKKAIAGYFEIYKKNGIKSFLGSIANELGRYFEDVVIKEPQKIDYFFEIQDKLPMKYKMTVEKDFVSIDKFWKSLEEKKIAFWDLIPERYKEIKKINKIKWLPSHEDKGLMDIVKPFADKDNLNIVKTGSNFDERGITTTDAWKLLFIPAKVKENGIYCMVKQCWAGIDANNKEGKVEGSFPNYAGVIPQSFDFKYNVKIDVLREYCNIADEIRFYNNVVKMFAFKFDEGQYDKGTGIVYDKFIGFKIPFIVDSLDAMAKLGYTEVSFCVNNATQPAVITPVGESKNINDFKVPFVLIMPMMLGDNDPDFYFDLNTECVVNGTNSSCLNQLEKVKINLKKATERAEKTNQELKAELDRIKAEEEYKKAVKLQDIENARLAGEMEGRKRAKQQEYRDIIEDYGELLSSTKDKAKQQEYKDILEDYHELLKSTHEVVDLPF